MPSNNDISSLKKYRKAISAVIAKDDKFLIVKNKGWNPPVWAFIQGGVKEGESEEDAVKREILEEIGSSKIKLLGKYPIPHKYEFPDEIKKKKGFFGQEQFAWYVEYLSDKNDITLSANEVLEWKWCTKEEVIESFTFPEQKEFFIKVLNSK